MPRLVVFGGGGFVGGNLCTIAARRGWEVHVADAGKRQSLAGTVWHATDVTDAGAVRALMQYIRPDAVVDLAAVADIDRAQKEQRLAWAVNVEAAGTIGSACAELGAACLYLSSDAVYAGTGASCREEDALDPVNYYGRTKAEGERVVSTVCPGATLVRMSLALGFPVAGGNSFLAGLETKLMTGAPIVAPSDEVRTPVDVLTLADCLLELLEVRPAGPINIGATGSVDRATLTRKAAALLGYPDVKIRTQAGGAAGNEERAPRHKNGIISVARAQGLLKTPLLSVDRTIERAVKERLSR